MFNREKANKLRKEANKQASLERLYASKWEKEASKPNLKKSELKKINKRNRKLIEKQSNKADKAYKKYHEYIHKNKSKKEIDKAMHGVVKNKIKLGFTSKSFLDELE